MEIKELIERVRAATGPDRELDGAIEVQARRFDAYRAGLDDANRAHWLHNGPTVYDGNTGYEAAKVTASIDAALALVERRLPGFSMRLATVDVTASDRNPMSRAVAELVPNLHNDEAWQVGIKSASAQTLPLAIILALLTALDQKEENK